MSRLFVTNNRIVYRKEIANYINVKTLRAMFVPINARLVIGTSRTVGSAKKFVRITSGFGGGEFTKTLRKVSIRFYHMKSGHWNHLALPYLESLFNFHLGDSNVDLKNGVITISSDHGEVAENLTMAFGVALLHVLCQPRKKLKRLGENTTPMRGIKLIKTIPSDDLGLVVAAGYSVEARRGES
jgi:hypothetical protein